MPQATKQQLPLHNASFYQFFYQLHINRHSPERKQNSLDCIIPKTIDRNENCSGGPLVLGFNPTDDDFSRSGPFRYDIDLEDDH